MYNIGYETLLSLKKIAVDILIPPFIWGPDWVAVWIIGPDGSNFTFNLPRGEIKWNSSWDCSPEAIKKMAKKKATLAHKYKKNTDEILSQPELFVWEGELYAGGIFRNSFAVGVSGAEEWTDHYLAECISARIMLEFRKEKGMLL